MKRLWFKSSEKYDLMIILTFYQLVIALFRVLGKESQLNL